MGQLTSDMIKKLSNFRQEVIDALTADLNAGMNVDAIASGAASLAREITEWSITGTVAATLAAPTSTGQRKTIRCVAAASIPLGTLTVTAPDDVTGFVCPATFVFDTAGQEVSFEATAALKWRCVGVKRCGGAANNVVVGTTLTSAMALWAFFGLSVTGTVSSTTAASKGLPNGATPGERIKVSCTTAASIPVGNIGFIGRSKLGAAVTDIGAIGAAEEGALLEWDGVKWQVMLEVGTVTIA